MELILFMLSTAAVIAGALRALRNGAEWELVTAVTLLAGCVLFSGGAIVRSIERLRRKGP